MKKLSIFILSIIISLLSVSVYAASGDIIGEIYSTDIRAYINGVEVPSYNIGGKTAVIIEDITTNYEYCEPLRTLCCWGFHPESLKTGNNSYNQRQGRSVGNIYETDIITYLDGAEVPCFSLNGKMAVVIEEIGGDNEFSDRGKKYIWNGEERTIKLETLYNNNVELHNLLSGKHLNANVDFDTMMVEFEPEPIVWGSIYSDGHVSDGVYELTYNGEVIGYSYRYETVNFAVDENGEYSLDIGLLRPYEWYWNIEKINGLLNNIKIIQPTYEDWMEHFEQNMYKVISEFETEEYHFLYLSQPNTHGSSQFLEKISKLDGTRASYGELFKSVSLYGQRYFEDVTIDKENEKVYLHYDTDYVIDLQTDEIKPLEDRQDLLLEIKIKEEEK